jgi:phosphoribosylamine--glycine ligase
VTSYLHDDVQVIHSCTRCADSGFVTSGGRVFGVTALAATAGEARRKAYERAESIQFPGRQFRTDIALA